MKRFFVWLAIGFVIGTLSYVAYGFFFPPVQKQAGIPVYTQAPYWRAGAMQGKPATDLEQVQPCIVAVYSDSPDADINHGESLVLEYYCDRTMKIPGYLEWVKMAPDRNSLLIRGYRWTGNSWVFEKELVYQ